MPPLLKVDNLKRAVSKDKLILSNISFELNHGELMFLRGPSGVGKSLLLRSLACLDKFQGGTIALYGRTPEDLGHPSYRAQVSYLSQARLNLKGTPADYYFQVQQFATQRGRPRGDLPALTHAMGLDSQVLNQPWTQLSGGQAQRVALAVLIALRPLILLLDEPTSACDNAAARRVEAVVRSCGAAVIWITHDDHQQVLPGDKMLELPGGQIIRASSSVSMLTMQNNLTAATAAAAAAEAMDAVTLHTPAAAGNHHVVFIGNGETLDDSREPEPADKSGESFLPTGSYSCGSLASPLSSSLANDSCSGNGTGARNSAVKDSFLLGSGAKAAGPTPSAAGLFSPAPGGADSAEALASEDDDDVHVHLPEPSLAVAVANGRCTVACRG